MTPARSLLIAMAAVALLIGARPIAGDEQFPRGLMAGPPEPRAPERSCTIETRPLSFGTYDPLAETDLDAWPRLSTPASRGGNQGETGQEHPHRDGAGASNSFDRRMMVGPRGS